MAGADDAVDLSSMISEKLAHGQEGLWLELQLHEVSCNAATLCGRLTLRGTAAALGVGVVSKDFRSAFCTRNSRAALSVIIWSASRTAECCRYL
jgi:hypothetical protein